jgi:hypothetical protein
MKSGYDIALKEFFDQRELELLAEHMIAQRLPHLLPYGGETLTPWESLRELRDYYMENLGMHR